MKSLAIAAVLVMLAPLGTASAFQVVTPEQMKEAGMGVTEGGYFSHNDVADNNDVQFSFGNSRRSGGDVGYYGNVDGNGRFFGDRGDSSYRGCADYADSNASQLYAMNGRGYAYPCQRFR